MGNSTSSNVVGIDDIEIKTGNGCTVILKDVRHVPDLRLNLMSVTALDRQGYDNHFDKGKKTKKRLLDMKRSNLQMILSRCRVLELPLHLLNEILCRLTVDTIFSCKCVCKTFLEILRDPHFVELHLTRSAASVIDDGLILYDLFNISSFLLVYNNNNGRRIEHDISYSPPCQTMAMPASIASNSMFSIIGACNGLLCLGYKHYKSFYPIYYICNPILGEFFALPPVVKCSGFQQSRFGFCQKTKQYKVIIFVINTLQCMVYTLGSGEHYWRKINNAPRPPRYTAAFDCSLNGNLHWITSCTVSSLICSFNLETEQFSNISPPTCFSQKDFYTKVSNARIGLLGGFLCLSYQLEVKYEAFVLKDYDGMNVGCWTKEFSVDLISDFRLQGISFYYASVVSLLNNGDLLLQQRDSHHVLCLNIHNRVAKHMLADRVTRSGALSFLPSFISLKDILVVSNGGDVEVVQRKMARDLWSDSGLRFIRW